MQWRFWKKKKKDLEFKTTMINILVFLIKMKSIEKETEFYIQQTYP